MALFVIKHGFLDACLSSFSIKQEVANEKFQEQIKFATNGNANITGFPSS